MAMLSNPMIVRERVLCNLYSQVDEVKADLRYQTDDLTDPNPRVVEAARRGINRGQQVLDELEAEIRQLELEIGGPAVAAEYEAWLRLDSVA